MLKTDHGQFVLFNIYAPNAGERPARSRAHLKLRFLQALKDKADALLAAGREVCTQAGSLVFSSSLCLKAPYTKEVACSALPRAIELETTKSVATGKTRAMLTSPEQSPPLLRCLQSLVF